MEPQWSDVPGDGNCFYSSLCVALGIDDEVSAITMRKYIVSFIEQHQSLYQDYIPNIHAQSGFRSVISSQNKCGVYAEGPVINASADSLSITLYIHEYRAKKATGEVYEIAPSTGRSRFDALLRIDVDLEHYQALRPSATTQPCIS
jgi:hypothetical protein